MEKRQRKDGLLVATPAEEVEAERWLAIGRRTITREIDRHLTAMKPLIARQDYSGALFEAQKVNNLLEELKHYF